MAAADAPALSTVAFTAYNVLALAGGPRTAEQMLNVVPRGAAAYTEQALDEMVLRGWLTCDDQDRYDLRDKKRRLVRLRDRGDAKVDGATGRVAGGWGRWIVQCRDKGLMTLEAAIAESEAA